MSARSLVDTYYESLDEGVYTALESVLAEDFVHNRPDRKFEGRKEFLEFMRDERPQRESIHVIESKLVRKFEVVVRGRITTEEGDVLMQFVDWFTLSEGRITNLETFVREP